MFHNPGDDWHPGLEGISKVYFIPCFAISFQGIWCTCSVLLCVFLKAMSDELLSGRDTWNQLPGDTHLVLLLRCCLGFVSGDFLRFTMVNHYVSPPIGECFFTFSKHPGHANLSCCAFVSMIPIGPFIQKHVCFFGGEPEGVLLRGSLYKSWICECGVMFSIRSYQGWKNHYLFQPSGANLKAQSRPNVQLAGGNWFFFYVHP